MASIGGLEEYLISSFPLPPANVQQHPRDQAPKLTSLSYPQAKSRQLDNERVMITTPSSGLSVYDLNDQTALAAITLGPSFQPTTPAVARSLPLESADSIRVKHARKTWVAVQAPPQDQDMLADASDAASKGQVWQWTEHERKDGSTDGEPDKIVYPISSTLSALQAPRSLPNHLLLLASSGSLALATSENLSVVASLPTSSGVPTRQTLRAVHLTATSPATALLPAALRSLLPSHRKGAHLLFVTRHYQSQPEDFSATAATGLLSEIGNKKFKKTKRPSSAAVIDEAEARGADSQESGATEHRTEIELVLLDPEVEVEDSIEARARLVSLGSVVIDSSEAAEQVVVSDAGIVTTLSATRGQLKSWRIVPSSSISDAPNLWADIFDDRADGISLPPLTPIKTFSLSNKTLSPSSSQTRIIALHSSFILLSSLKPAAPSSSHDDASLAVTSSVWDVRLGAVVAAVTTSVPAAVTTSRSAVGISLSLPTSYTATLALYPLPQSQQQQQQQVSRSGSGSAVTAGGRVVIFGLPLAPPVVLSSSVLAAVVGKQALTASFLARNDDTAVSKPRLVEPIRHPRTSARKQVLLDASAQARTTVLEQLAQALTSSSSSGSRATADIDGAERAFSAFIEDETRRLREYNVAKVRVAAEREKERRVAALKARDESRTSTKKYELAKRRIEELIAEGGGEGSSWKEVTSKRIKGVSDVYRYKYYDERVALEEQMGQVTRDDSLEKALKAVEKQEPAMPSTFVTAVLRLCFPASTDVKVGPKTYIAAATALSQPGKTETVPQHPVGIVSALLARRLVGDGQIEGGVTRYLARAGDWANILLALDTMPDIPESTTVSLLKQVVAQQQQGAVADTTSTSSTGTLPQRAPELAAFLASFLRAPSTPATLRHELASQIGAAEALPILRVLDAWLSWWTRRRVNGDVVSDTSQPAHPAGHKQRLAIDPFAIPSKADVDGEELPPTVEQIIPLVSALLDAHFVALLLDSRSAHKTLTRLSRHVQTHVARIDELATLLGPLAVFARHKDDERRIRAEQRGGDLKTKVSAKSTTLSSSSSSSLGKSMEARIRAQEKHQQVGEYSIDRFYL